MVKALEAFNRLLGKGCSNEDLDIIKEGLEVLEVIYNSPFIIDNLMELGDLPPEAKWRYSFGTITNKEVMKVKEFFKNGEK